MQVEKNQGKPKPSPTKIFKAVKVHQLENCLVMIIKNGRGKYRHLNNLQLQRECNFSEIPNIILLLLPKKVLLLAI